MLGLSAVAIYFLFLADLQSSIENFMNPSTFQKSEIIWTVWMEQGCQACFWAILGKVVLLKLKFYDEEISFN